MGLALVESGHALVFRRFMSQCDAKAYLAAEQLAMRRRAGLWQVPVASPARRASTANSAAA
nr:hypothetical protein [Synechococcus sp. CS-1333]